MNNKKTKIIFAGLSLAFVLAGCGKESKNTSNNVESSQTENSEQVKDFDISVVSREDGSGTRGAFIELTGLEEKSSNGDKVDKTTEEAIVQNSTNAVMQTVSQDPNAIGYISLGSLNDSVKAIKIGGVEAKEENIKSGAYKLQRNFNLAYKKDIDDLSKDFLAFCLSSDAQKIAEEEGYISVESKDYKSTKKEGSITIAGSTSVTPLMEKLIESYKKVNPNASIDLQSTGSSSGIESTISGVSQIAMSSRELKEEEKKQLEEEVLAKDGIAIIVNKENTKIENLTMDQIKEIFSGKIKNTSEL